MRVFFLLVSLSAALNVSAQKLIPFEQNGKYGFATSEGVTVIEPQYDNVTEFGAIWGMKPDGSIKGHWDGFPVRVPGLELAHVKIDSCWTVIDKAGKMLVPCDSPHSLSILINGSTIYFADREEVEQAPVLKIINYSSRKWWLYDLKTNRIGNKTYHDEGYRNFDLQRIRRKDKCIIAKIVGGNRSDLIERSTNKILLENVRDLHQRSKNTYRYYNSTNELVTYHYKDPAMEGVPFEDFGKALLSDGSYFGEKLDQNYYDINGWLSNSNGISDTDFNILVDTIYEKVEAYHKHFVATRVDTNSKKKFLDLYDHQGNKLDVPHCVSIKPLNGNYLIGILESKKNILLDNEGSILSDTEYDYLEKHGRKKYNIFTSANNWGVLDQYGKEVVRYDCEELSLMQRNNEAATHFLIKKNGLYGVHSMDNGLVIPIKYKHIENTNYKHLLLLTDKHGRTGVATNSGRLLIPLEYEKIEAGYMQYIQENGDLDMKYRYICFKNGKEVAWFDQDFEPVSLSSVQTLRDKAPDKN